MSIIRVSNVLDPDQDRQNVGPDLDPNRLQRLSADDKNAEFNQPLSLQNDPVRNNPKMSSAA